MHVPLSIVITAAFCLGWFFCAMREAKRGDRERENLMQVGRQDLHITMSMDAVNAMLDRRGLVAVPKGAEFQVHLRDHQ